MILRTLSLLLIGSFYHFSTLAQFPGCPSVNAGADQSLPCTQSCTNLTATPFQTGATTSYTVASIPHTPPIAYNAAGGTPISVGTDDVWSPVINLPFAFCFYGQTYNSLIVGSNGTIGFDISDASGYNPWPFTASCPSAALSAAGNIFGPYHDIDPSIGGEVNYYSIGTAPCRIFVVSFNQLPHFSCTSIESTHMMVLYETTNVIDIYVENKSLCSGWNGGATIIGIQDIPGTQGLAAPGRNTTPTWTVTTPEAWRFSPSGAPTYTIEWLEAGSVIGISENITVCPSDTTTYTAIATYTRCDGTQIIEVDSVTINPSPLSPTVTEVSTTPASCGVPDGALEVIASGGAGGYTYSIDNGVTYQPSPIFSALAAGTYVVLAQDMNGCTGPVSITILNNSTLALVVNSSTDPSCSGGATGSIDIGGTGGTLPYTFSLNMGTPQTSGVFNSLAAATYNMTVFDNAGCSVSQFVTLNIPIPISVSETANFPESCAGNDGYSVLNVTGGSGVYTYSLDAGATTFPLDTVSNLSAGSYSVLVSDGQGCTNTFPVTISTSSTVSAFVSGQTDDECASGNGTVSIFSSGGSGIYMYSIDGGITFQSSFTIDSLSGGSYTVLVSDDMGCTTTVPVTINTTTLTAFEVGHLNITCNGDIDGQLEVNAFGTPPPYAFQLNAGTPQPTGIFTGLGAGTYTMTITDQNLCASTVLVTITEPTPIVVTTNNTTAICIGSTGSLTASASGGTGAFTYSWNNGVGAGANQTVSPTVLTTYIVTVTDANGCTNTGQVVVTVNPLPIIGAGSDQTICLGTGVTLSGTGGVAYVWNNGVTNSSVFTPTLGTVTYTVTGTDANGCVNTDQVTVTVVEVPVADFNAVGAVSGNPVLGVAFTNTSLFANSYSWTMGNGATFNTTNLSTNVSSQYSTPGTYTVILTASNGICQDTAQLQVIVIPFEPLVLHIPNVFTPDGDGINDFFYIDVANGATILVEVINRWGNKMIVMNDFAQKWDGADASDGVYFFTYAITGVDGTSQTGQGFVELFR